MGDASRKSSQFQSKPELVRSEKPVDSDATNAHADSDAKNAVADYKLAVSICSDMRFVLICLFLPCSLTF
jgi:hypothetical protein